MANLFFILYIILIAVGAISNFFGGSEQNEGYQVALIVTFHYGAILMYILSQINNAKVRTLIVPKYFYCFAISYKEFTLNVFSNLILMRTAIIPLLLSPIFLLISRFSFSKILSISIVLYLMTAYTLFVVFILFHLWTIKKNKLNFNYLLILTFAVPFYFADKFDNPLALAVNPIGTFISAPLFANSNILPYVLIIQVLFVSSLTFLIFKRVLKEWPVY
ncbi:MAG: hypothetical protein HRU69_13825 [Flammeovirgaceae bacterium]|nr:MAG: hypothetical protein HRU69_13825 [Flammeovirgaceae bacterium]